MAETETKREIWVDIDTATREEMAMVFAQERKNIVEHLSQMTMDMDHWNDLHPSDASLQLCADFKDDIVEWRLANNYPAPASSIYKGEGGAP